MADRATEPSAPRVALFVTCMVDTLYPEVGLAAAALLERHGVEVIYPEQQTCCGQPAFNAGYRGQARSVARHFLDVFHPLIAGRQLDAIVAPSGSCVAMVRHQYRVLFEDAEQAHERRRVELVSDATYELTEYLVDVLGVREGGTRFPATIAYHPCCHLLRELKVDAQPRRLLAGVEGTEIVELAGAEECCGFGGLFALKNAAISTAMVRRKAGNIAAARADYIVVNDVSCMAHINGILSRRGSHARAIHIARVLQPGGDAPREGDSHDR
ncbi:MAG: (Fe-S)-binding protein [Gemmatimonadales bacterium]|jgi:L-lactate dehydrogenase complex protein LldE